MEYALSELFTLQMGKTPSRDNSSYWEKSENNWISIADLTNSGKYISNTKETLSDSAVAESGIKKIPANTVIMSFKLSLGKVAITEKEMYSNEAIMAFIDKGVEKISPEYLYYLLRAKDWSKGTNKAVMGATLNKATLSTIKIQLHEYDNQLEIVNMLNRVSSSIDFRKQQLTKLDELIKARFVEMFGDMLLNSLEWPEKPLEGLADIVSGITKGRKTTETGLIEVPYMAVSNVKSGYIDWTTIKTILATKQEIEQYRLMPDDILMTEGGDPDKVGRGAIIKNPLENSIHQNHIFRVRLDKSELLPAYFAEYLQHQKAKRYFLGCAKQTTGIASINMRQLRALPVLIPPLSLQNQFAAFVAEVDKSKLFVGSAVAHKPFDIEFFSKSTVQRPIKEV